MNIVKFQVTQINFYSRSESLVVILNFPV